MHMHIEKLPCKKTPAKKFELCLRAGVELPFHLDAIVVRTGAYCTVSSLTARAVASKNR
jgi:hypothetical protein